MPLCRKLSNTIVGTSRVASVKPPTLAPLVRNSWMRPLLPGRVGDDEAAVGCRDRTRSGAAAGPARRRSGPARAPSRRAARRANTACARRSNTKYSPSRRLLAGRDLGEAAGDVRGKPADRLRRSRPGGSERRRSALARTAPRASASGRSRRMRMPAWPSRARRRSVRARRPGWPSARRPTAAGSLLRAPG